MDSDLQVFCSASSRALVLTHHTTVSFYHCFHFPTFDMFFFSITSVLNTIIYMCTFKHWPFSSSTLCNLPTSSVHLISCKQISLTLLDICFSLWTTEMNQGCLVAMGLEPGVSSNGYTAGVKGYPFPRIYEQPIIHLERVHTKYWYPINTTMYFLSTGLHFEHQMLWKKQNSFLNLSLKETWYYEGCFKLFSLN